MKEIKIILPGTEDEYLELPESISSYNQLLIPQKLIKAVDYLDYSRFLNDSTNRIDLITLKEICLLFLSSLNSQIYYRFSDNDKTPDGTNLLATIIKETLGIGNDYVKIISILELGNIIEVNHSYEVNKSTKCYKLAEKYYTKLAIYNVQSNFVKQLIRNRDLTNYSKSVTNPIVKNLIEFYKGIEIPTPEALLEIGNHKCANKERNKKGKLFTKLGKNALPYPNRYSYWKSDKCFFEDDIEFRYKYLTEPGFFIPKTTSNCPRVFDMISLISSWCRNYIKHNGEALVELDYKCLHPNLIMTLYGCESIKYLTHQIVAEATGISLKEVKDLHLSFFNSEINQIKSKTYKKLYNYYNNLEPGLLQQIEQDKYIYGYKITSEQLFALEVNLMTEVIRQLNTKGIYVGYIYDALLAKPNDVLTVKETMIRVARDMKIYTTVK